jgi:multidrug efflux pump
MKKLRGMDPLANQVAAVSLTMPIYLILMALGNIFGVGGGSLVSRLLGAKESGRVKNVSSFSFLGCIAAGLLFTIGILVFMEPLLHVIGTSPQTIGFSRDYLRYIAYGAVSVVLSYAFGSIIRAEGASTESTIGMAIGTVVNILLDPIMISSMRMGVAGAAIATIIGNVCSAVYYIVYIVKGRKTYLSIKPSDITLHRSIWSEIVAIGLPASLTNLLMSVANVLLNVLIAGYGDKAIAAMGVASKCFIMPVLLLTGLGQGVQPFVGYNYAAKNYHRMTKSIRFSILVSIGIGSVLTVFLFAFALPIVRFFIRDDDVVRLGGGFLRAISSIGPVLGIFFVLTFVFQAIGLALPSLILSISRQGLVFIPALFIGKALFGLSGVVWAQPLADLLSLLMSVVFFIRSMRTITRNKHLPIQSEATASV